MLDTNKPNLLSSRFRGYYPVVIDVETSGFNAETNALLEIAAVTLAFDKEGWLKPNQKFHFHVTPFLGSILETEALAFNRIDPANPLRGAISERDALNTIFFAVTQSLKEQGCKRAVIVGHNASFDHNFVMAAAKRSGLVAREQNPFHPFTTIDTAALSALILGQTVLIKACLTAGIAFDKRQAHSAIYDAERTAELFCELVNRWKKIGGWPLAVTDT